MRFARLCSSAFLLAASNVCDLDAQWVPTNGPMHGGIPVSFTYSLVANRSDSSANLFAGTHKGYVFQSTDNGINWMKIDGGGPMLSDTGGFTRHLIQALALSGGYLFAGTQPDGFGQGAGVFRCAINDTHWTAANNGLANLKVFSLMPYVNGPNDTILFAGTLGGGVFRSTDDGVSWIPANEGLTNLFVLALSYKVDTTGFTSIFAGTSLGVYVSTNAGGNWMEFQNELTPYSVYSIVVARYLMRNPVVYAGTDAAGVFRSSNNGVNWTAVNTGLPANAYVASLAANDTIIYAGTGNVVYYTLDNGAHWNRSSSGFSGCGGVNALTVSDTNLFVGIGGCEPSAWRRPLSEMLTDVEDRDMQIPSGFSLEQNFPNPFNPSTTIFYRVPTRGFVSLKVYNLLGQEVAILVDEMKQPGSYDVKWNATGLSSGIYFYQLRAGSFMETKKLILMK